MALLLSYEVAFNFLQIEQQASKLNISFTENSKSRDIVKKWLNEISTESPEEYKISDYTLANLLSFAYYDGIDVQIREQYEQVFKEWAKNYLRHNLLKIDTDTLFEWSKIRHWVDYGDQQLVPDIGIDVALCRLKGLTYVGRRTPTIEKILGDRIISPWEICCYD